MGCTTVVLKEPLADEEMEDLQDYLHGQFSDGWGEGFEQQEIFGTLFVCLKFRRALLGKNGFGLAGSGGCGSRFFQYRHFLDVGFTGLCSDEIKAEIVVDTLDLRGVIRKYHDLDMTGLSFIADRNVQKPMLLGFLYELLHVGCGNIKKLERTLLFEHPHKPCLAMCFRLVL